MTKVVNQDNMTDNSSEKTSITASDNVTTISDDMSICNVLVECIAANCNLAPLIDSDNNNIDCKGIKKPDISTSDDQSEVITSYACTHAGCLCHVVNNPDRTIPHCSSRHLFDNNNQNYKFVNDNVETTSLNMYVHVNDPDDMLQTILGTCSLATKGHVKYDFPSGRGLLKNIIQPESTVVSTIPNTANIDYNPVCDSFVFYNDKHYFIVNKSDVKPNQTGETLHNLFSTNSLKQIDTKESITYPIQPSINNKTYSHTEIHSIAPKSHDVDLSTRYTEHDFKPQQNESHNLYVPLNSHL
jgi:hypothetical protein